MEIQVILLIAGWAIAVGAGIPWLIHWIRKPVRRPERTHQTAREKRLNESSWDRAVRLSAEAQRSNTGQAIQHWGDRWETVDSCPFPGNTNEVRQSFRRRRVPGGFMYAVQTGTNLGPLTFVPVEPEPEVEAEPPKKISWLVTFTESSGVHPKTVEAEDVYWPLGGEPGAFIELGNGKAIPHNNFEMVARFAHGHVVSVEKIDEADA